MSVARGKIVNVVWMHPRVERDLAEHWAPDVVPSALPTEWLGIDVGFIYPAVDSDGVIYRWARTAEPFRPKVPYAEAGPVRIRKADGSERTFDAYSPDQFQDVFARARDEGYRARVGVLAGTIVKKARESERGIALEDWSDFRRRRAAWVELWREIKARAEKYGAAVRTVPAAWTSTTCPRCGDADPANRPSRDVFLCLSCGLEGQSDRIAASNIRNRALAGNVTSETLAVCRNPVCDRAPFRKGTCCSCYFFHRRRYRWPNEDELATLRAARNYSQFKAILLEQHRQLHSGDVAQ